MTLWLSLANHVRVTGSKIAHLEDLRRRLKSADIAEASLPVFSRTSVTWRRHAVVVAMLLLPVLAGSFYVWISSSSAAPAVGGSASSAPRSDDVMIAQVEAHLRRRPDEGRAWEILAPVYMRLGR